MRFARNEQGFKMNKRPQTKGGFFSWLMGSGWGGGGNHG
jgi:hypothetical protein